MADPHIAIYRAFDLEKWLPVFRDHFRKAQDPPRFHGATHSPDRCGSHGYVKTCRFCDQCLYLWTCNCLRPTWLPFESWENGNVKEGTWEFHDAYCKTAQAKQYFEALPPPPDDPPEQDLYGHDFELEVLPLDVFWRAVKPGSWVMHHDLGIAVVVEKLARKRRLKVRLRGGLCMEIPLSDELCLVYQR